MIEMRKGRLQRAHGMHTWKNFKGRGWEIAGVKSCTWYLQTWVNTGKWLNTTEGGKRREKKKKNRTRSSKYHVMEPLSCYMQTIKTRKKAIWGDQ